MWIFEGMGSPPECQTRWQHNRLILLPTKQWAPFYKYQPTRLSSSIHLLLQLKQVRLNSNQYFLLLFTSESDMGIRLPSMILNAKQAVKLQSRYARNLTDVPKGHIAVYVGEFQKTRFVVPISYLSHPSFLDLLDQAEKEFGFTHPMGGLTIPRGLQWLANKYNSFHSGTVLHVEFFKPLMPLLSIP